MFTSLYLLRSLSLLLPLCKTESFSDDDNDDGGDVVAEEALSVSLLFVPGPACCSATAGGARLPAQPAQEYLFICLQLQRESLSFFIFRHSASKQVVP